jgi:hypothetical protein
MLDAADQMKAGSFAGLAHAAPHRSLNQLFADAAR